DGKIDVVASNWGRNTKYQRYADQRSADFQSAVSPISNRHPLQSFYADLRNRGVVDLIEAHFDPALNAIVPWRSKDALTATLPVLDERAPSFEAFSTLSVSNLFAEDFAKLRSLSANTLDTSVFLNRGDHFEHISLPIEAQFAPAFGVNVADFDGDGFEDIFL